VLLHDLVPQSGGGMFYVMVIQTALIKLFACVDLVCEKKPFPLPMAGLADKSSPVPVPIPPA
jgi:hypothetical protein